MPPGHRPGRTGCPSRSADHTNRSAGRSRVAGHRGRPAGRRGRPKANRRPGRSGLLLGVWILAVERLPAGLLLVAAAVGLATRLSVGRRGRLAGRLPVGRRLSVAGRAVVGCSRAGLAIARRLSVAGSGGLCARLSVAGGSRGIWLAVAGGSRRARLAIAGSGRLGTGLLPVATRLLVGRLPVAGLGRRGGWCVGLPVGGRCCWLGARLLTCGLLISRRAVRRRCAAGLFLVGLARGLRARLAVLVAARGVLARVLSGATPVVVAHGCLQSDCMTPLILCGWWVQRGRLTRIMVVCSLMRPARRSSRRE